MDEQQGREFNTLELLAVVSFAMALWAKYAPAGNKTRPDERYLIRVLNGVKTEMRAQTEQLRQGKLSQAEWFLNMRRFQDAIYIISSAVLVGTFELTAPALELGSEQWRTQDAALAGFGAQVVSGEQKNNGTLLTRVGLYAAAGWSVYQALRGTKAVFLDAVSEARILGVADHCPDCITEAAKGRQPIGTLRKIGDSVCLANCHCKFVYYNRAGAVVKV